jgi:hypothetical protein
MRLPILERLKDGEKFDFETLAENVEQTYDFWEWWWEEKAQDGVLSRPEVISDDDPILIQTSAKPFTEFGHYKEFYDRGLLRAVQANILPQSGVMSRAQCGEALKQLLGAGCSAILQTRPQLVFAGGGYGSGKTSTLNYLAEVGCLPVEMRHMIGVDMFKPLLPEFNLIKAVADGRASLTVQAESQKLASELFGELIEARRSFIWDSSMSDTAGTHARIQQAKSESYEMTMIAILTPVERAAKWAMERARDSRRFPHPEALPRSHVEFRAAFDSYVPLFDEIKLFANEGGGPEDCLLIAEKTAGMNELVIHEDAMFSAALSGQKPN